MNFENRPSVKLINEEHLDKGGHIKPDSKYRITIPEINIVNPKFLAKPEDKFESCFYQKGKVEKGKRALELKDTLSLAIN